MSEFGQKQPSQIQFTSHDTMKLDSTPMPISKSFIFWVNKVGYLFPVASCFIGASVAIAKINNLLPVSDKDYLPIFFFSVGAVFIAGSGTMLAMRLLFALTTSGKTFGTLTEMNQSSPATSWIAKLILNVYSVITIATLSIGAFFAANWFVVLCTGQLWGFISR